tara:strand:+ start:235 stop:651 length:417 start_codon:yes stop_codon:yes gene_type:complete
MGEEFYAIIKLVSGEEILTSVCIDEGNDEPVIIIHNPVVMKMINSTHGSFIKVKPWIELASDDMFILRNDKIITMTEIKDQRTIAVYEKFLADEKDDTLDFQQSINGLVQPSEDMGYISTVQQARELFEKLFNINKES